MHPLHFINCTVYNKCSTVHRKGNGEPVNCTILRFFLPIHQLNIRALWLTVHPKMLCSYGIITTLIAYSIISAKRACFISADGGLCNCTPSKDSETM